MQNVPKWPERVFIGFGIANLAFALLGGLLQGSTLLSYQQLPPSYGAPYQSQAFYIMASVNIIFLVWLAATGAYLIKKDVRIITYCNVLFALEIIYFPCVSLLWMNSTYGMSVGAATGIGNMGLSCQLITGYPIISLIVLNIARAKLKQAQRTTVGDVPSVR